MEALIERYRRYLHDIHNIFGNLRRLAQEGNSEAVVKLIDELEGELRGETAGEAYTNNGVLNAVLAEQKEKAKKQEIDIQIFVEKCLHIDFISNVDMISMFGNLLDNALEAAGKCEPGNRKVDIRLFMGSKYMLVLYIKNSYVVPIKRDGNRILTSKENGEEHGLGIRIVERLAEKYGGTLKLEDGPEDFCTTLTLSVAVSKNNIEQI